MLYVEQLRSLVPRARDVIGGLSDSQVNWRPVQGSWSIARVHRAFEHHECTLLSGASNKASTMPDSKGCFIERQNRDSAFLSDGSPTVSNRRIEFAVKAPKQFAPPSRHYDRDELLARWVSVHERLIKLSLAKTSDLDWKKTKVRLRLRTESGSALSAFSRLSGPTIEGICGKPNRCDRS